MVSGPHSCNLLCARAEWLAKQGNREQKKPRQRRVFLCSFLQGHPDEKLSYDMCDEGKRGLGRLWIATSLKTASPSSFKHKPGFWHGASKQVQPIEEHSQGTVADVMKCRKDSQDDRYDGRTHASHGTDPAELKG
ncbi:uncharacterized protein M437DRAFT_64877 [Aureobasidium melanogenum CBS 110374]|uniref:Uncharacterized protein n=1 Tax=Aureobasidium melanogenum (strain CBS 110374) TaxID=1043003 RepID=A0A074VV31_AURM1|nr:uncharacterized protein M437DRAFT_64877 [Aureobasidium melanogenum CBS 110374]KEQ64333.1 hypothetical protein M437DRAFT_64877 [Aureobasidium melanogenum CBS 110374]